MLPRKLFIGVLTALVLLAAAQGCSKAKGGTAPAQPVTGAPADPVRALTFTTLGQGAYSGFTERTAVLVTDSAAWQSTWGQLSARQVPKPPAPAVDFSSQSVLVVALGEQRTGGYSITVTGASLENGRLKVSVRVTAPKPGDIVTQALTQPYHMVRLPKLPTGTAVEVNW